MFYAHRFFKSCPGLALAAFLLWETTPSSAATTNELVYLGQWPPGAYSPVTSVQASGNYVYASIARGGLSVVDITDPRYPVTRINIQTTGSSWGLALSGTILHLADGDGGLKFYDVSDPPQPRLLGTYPTPGEARAVRLVGNLAYVAAGSAGVLVLDVRDPEHVILKGQFDTEGYASDLDVVGNMAYIADGSAGLQILDVRDPAHITRVGQYNALSNARGLRVTGTTALVADGKLVHALDVTQPGSIRWLSLFRSTNDLPVTGMQVVGTNIFVADGYKVVVYSLADPTSAQWLGYFYGSSMHVVGNTAYVGNYTGNVGIYDVTTVAAAKRLDVGSPVVTAGFFQVADGKIFGQPNAGAGPGIKVVDIADPARPFPLPTIISDAFVNHFEIQGTLLYSICSNSQLRVYDIRNVSAPTLLGTFTSDTPLRKVHVNGGGAYLLGTNTTIRVVSVNNPASMTLLGSAYLDWKANDFQVVGTRLYLAVGNLGFQMLETRNPAGIFWMPGYGYDTENDTRDLHVVGTKAYVADHDSLQIFDMSHLPGAPRWVRFTGVSADVVRVAGTRAFVGQNQRVSVLDVSDNTAPHVVGEFPGVIGTEIRHLQLDGDQVYVAQDHVGWVFLHHRERTFQTLSLAVPSLLAVTNAPIQLEAIASSGLPVTWSVVSGPGRLHGTELTLTGPGTIVVRADQAGSDTFAPARVEKTITVFRLQQTLSFDPISPALPKLHEGIHVTARASSGLPVTIELASGPARWQDNQIVLTNRGLVTVRAVQAGNDLFEPTSMQQALYPIVPQPALLGEWPGRRGEFSEDVAISGTQAVIAYGLEGLAVVDVSDPTRPNWLGVQEFDGRFTQVAVSGNLALVAVDDLMSHYWLEIIDISDPTRMVSLAKYPCPDHIGRVRVAGSKVYLACASRGMVILDISHPAVPVKLGGYEWPSGTSLNDFEVRSILAYCGMGNGQLEILNVRQPDHVVRVGGASANGSIDRLHLVETYVFAVGNYGSSSSTFTVFDVTAYTAPKMLGTTTIWNSGVSGLQVKGSRAFLAHGEAGLLAVDISNLTKPTSIGTYTGYGSAKSVLVSGQTLYWPSPDMGLQILDVSNPAQVRRLSGDETQVFGYGVSVVGTRAYLANGTRGFDILDISNPKNITRLGNANTPGDCLAVQVVGKIAYVADGEAGFETYSLTNTDAPVMLSRYQALYMPPYAYDQLTPSAVQVVGTNAYVTGGDWWVFNVSDPARLRVSQHRSWRYESFSNFVMVGLTTFLISPIMAVDPRFEAMQPFEGRAIAARGNLLYLGGWGHFEVLDATIPTQIRRIAEFRMAEPNMEITAIQLAGNLAYLSCGKAGVRVLDISDPRKVVTLQSFPAYNARGLQVIGQTAYVADGQRGLRILQLDAAKYHQEIAFPEPPSPQPPDSTVTLQAAASSGLPIHYRVLAGPAVVTNSQELLLTGSGLIYVQAQQEGDDTFLPAESVTISVAAAARDPLPDLVAQWIQANDPSIPASGRGLHDDPDADGASNGVEWLLGTDPSVADSAASRLPMGNIVRDPQGTAVWTWRFTLGSGVAEDTPWMLEHASNLAGTDWSAVPAEWLIRNGREVQVVMPVNSTSRFVRLRLGW